jgi:ribosomal protein S18 acetylase RimI-like enzyme
MDAETRALWLEPPHFEVVELHVAPDRQRRGIGSRLLDALLARQPHARALLTADPAGAQALPFYAKHGWAAVAEVELVPGRGRRVVLAKRVAAPAQVGGRAG